MMPDSPVQAACRPVPAHGRQRLVKRRGLLRVRERSERRKGRAMKNPDNHTRARRRRAASALLGTLATVLAVSGTPGALAQPSAPYPVKPIRMVVPFAAGGSNDVIARLIGPRMTEAFGQTVVVDNRPGAGSVIGSEIVARAAGDGYTLLLADSALGFALAVQGRQVYDAVKDFTPITLIGNAPMMLLVPTPLPVQSLKDYLALARQQGGKLTVGSGGLGGVAHLSSELVQLRAGIRLTHIAYKGAGPAVADLVGGHHDGLVGVMVRVGDVKGRPRIEPVGHCLTARGEHGGIPGHGLHTDDHGSLV